MKILLADDEVNLRNALAAIIKHAGYEVTIASDGQEAVEKASEGTFDVMLFDVMMPRKTGIEALKEIREKGIKTPVLLLTAMSEIEDKINGLDAAELEGRKAVVGYETERTKGLSKDDSTNPFMPKRPKRGTVGTHLRRVCLTHPLFKLLG